MKSKILRIVITFVITFVMMFLLQYKNVFAFELQVGAAKMIDGGIQVKEESEEQFTNEEIEMLQKIAIAEAKCDSPDGMAYVIKVILNRVESEKFPNTIEDVIFQDNPVQFSTVKNGSYSKAIPNEDSMKAYEIAKTYDIDALYFESTSNENSWQSRNLEYLFTYKHHKFYK